MTTSRNIYILVEGDSHHAYENIRAFLSPEALVKFLRAENKKLAEDHQPTWKLVPDGDKKWTNGTFLRWIEEAVLDE